jgi:hypothetical protein
VVAGAAKFRETLHVSFLLEERDDVTCGWAESVLGIAQAEAAGGVASQESSNRDYGLSRELIV